MRLLPVFLFLAACSPPPDFLSTCQTPVYGTQGDQQEAYNALERRIRYFFSHIDGWSDERVCTQLSHYSVEIRRNPDGSEMLSWPYQGLTVTGLTTCPIEHRIQIGSQNFRLSALAHEAAHAIEDCADPTHSTWAERGINDALIEIQRLPATDDPPGSY